MKQTASKKKKVNAEQWTVRASVHQWEGLRLYLAFLRKGDICLLLRVRDGSSLLMSIVETYVPFTRKPPPGKRNRPGRVGRV